MSRLFYHVMQDNLGNLLFDVTGTMRLAGTGTLATIYGDEALTVILPNPMTNHPSYGSFKCYLGAGDYDFYMAKAGYTFETLTGVQGHGTMAQQDASAVAITGGTIAVSTLNASANVAGQDALTVYPGSATVNRLGIGVIGHSLPGGSFETNGDCGIGGPIMGGIRLRVSYNKDSAHGILMQPGGSSDATAGNALIFYNIAQSLVGTIYTSATATSYNTTSDARLKHAITPLTGALDVVRRLRPITHLWNADGSPGEGFLAHELQREVPLAVTGEPDAVDEKGQIVPQQVDHSKLVPRLTAALGELAAQVETLLARVQSLETQLGV